MMKQKGQSAVEFAIIAPMFFMICLATIYAGIIFMDYIQYSNAARAIARDIALSPISLSPTSDRIKDTIIKEVDGKNGKDLPRYVTQLTNLYNATFEVKPKTINSTNRYSSETEEVTVSVKFTLAEPGERPQILNDIDFPPLNLKTIEYKMRVENKGPNNTN